MKEYKIQQKASVWYETIVEAKTKKEALQKAETGNDNNWELLLDTVIFEDDFEIMEDN